MASPIDSPVLSIEQEEYLRLDWLSNFVDDSFALTSPIGSSVFCTEQDFMNEPRLTDVPEWFHDVTVTSASADRRRRRLLRMLPTDSLTVQFDPAANRRLTYLSGGFHQQAFCPSNSRWFHTSEVHDQRILNSTRVEEQPLHWGWVPSQLHPGSDAMLDLIQHPTGVEEQQLFNRPRVPETFLGITSQSALTMLTIWISSSTSFSEKAKILFCSAAACNVIGFLFCLFSILLSGRKTGVAHRIVTGTGFVFTAYGFLAIMGMLLSDNIMLWVTGLACIASLPALASAFMK